MPFAAELRGTALIWMEVPDHTRLRKLVSAGFTPRILGRLDGLLLRGSAQTLDAAASIGEINFVTEVAYQLPLHVTGHARLGCRGCRWECGSLLERAAGTPHAPLTSGCARDLRRSPGYDDE